MRSPGWVRAGCRGRKQRLEPSSSSKQLCLFWVGTILRAPLNPGLWARFWSIGKMRGVIQGMVIPPAAHWLCVSCQHTHHLSLWALFISNIQERSECPQEPARIVLILSLPGLCFISGILEGKSKERLVECRYHCLVVTLVKGIT